MILSSGLRTGKRRRYRREKFGVRFRGPVKSDSVASTARHFFGGVLSIVRALSRGSDSRHSFNFVGRSRTAIRMKIWFEFVGIFLIFM